MPRSGRVPHGEAIFEDGRRKAHHTPPDDWWQAPLQRPSADADDGGLAASGAGVRGRRTVTITGLGAEGYASRNGTRPSAAARRSQLKRHERAGFRPDRVAMWAVLLGVMLMLAAVTSSHAAALAVHHISALAQLRPH